MAFGSKFDIDEMIRFVYIDKFNNASETAHKRIGIWAPNGNLYKYGEDNETPLSIENITPVSFCYKWSPDARNIPIKNRKSIIGVPNDITESYLLMIGYNHYDEYLESFDYNIEGSSSYSNKCFILSSSGAMYYGSTPEDALYNATTWNRNFRVNPFYILTKMNLMYGAKYIAMKKFAEDTEEELPIKEDYLALCTYIVDKDDQTNGDSFVPFSKTQENTVVKRVLFNKGIFSSYDQSIYDLSVFDYNGNIIPSIYTKTISDATISST